MAGLSRKQRLRRKHDWSKFNATVKANPTYSPGSDIRGTEHGGILPHKDMPLSPRFVESKGVTRSVRGTVVRGKVVSKRFKRWGTK